MHLGEGQFSSPFQKWEFGPDHCLDYRKRSRGPSFKKRLVNTLSKFVESMSTFSRITEQSSLHDGLEHKSTRELLEGINQEDRTVALAVQKTIPQI